MTKMSRRGLFGLGVGAAALAVVPKAKPVVKAVGRKRLAEISYPAEHSLNSYSGYEVLTISPPARKSVTAEEFHEYILKAGL